MRIFLWEYLSKVSKWMLYFPWELLFLLYINDLSFLYFSWISFNSLSVYIFLYNISDLWFYIPLYTLMVCHLVSRLALLNLVNVSHFPKNSQFSSNENTTNRSWNLQPHLSLQPEALSGREPGPSCERYYLCHTHLNL